MLGKLFKSKKTPQNDGELMTHSRISNLRLKKVIELELVNMEGRPCYRLISKLGIGSEIGDILIADDSISARHCTFSLDQDVITLIDHKSINGTYVNDRAIEAGKSIILDENDQIQIGELLIQIKTHNQAVVSDEEFIITDDEEETELLVALTDLDDKFEDNTKILNQNMTQENATISRSTLLEESGINIDEIIMNGTQVNIHTLEGFELSSSNEFNLDTLEKDEEEDIEALFKNDKKINLEEADDDDEDDEQESRENLENDKKNIKRTSRFAKLLLKFKRNKAPQKSFRSRSRKVVANEYAANTILRIVALHIDLSFAYGTYLLVSPFNDFSKFINMINAKGSGWITLISQSELYKTYEGDISIFVEMFKDIWIMVDTYINPVPTLVIFALTKLIMNLFLGVSLGQFLVGIKSSGNVAWKRIGGFIRTGIGFITFPFLVFDIGAIISRRTFKEVVTFTRLYSEFKLLNILRSFVFVTASALFVLMAPMFQGFELTKRYEMPAKIDERVKVQDSGEEKPEISSSFSSKFFGLKVNLNEDFETLPGFKFEGSGNKTTSQFVLNIYDKKMEGSSQIEILKNFSMKQLLDIGFKGNPFIRLKYPHLDNFLNQHTPVGFKRSVLNSESFSHEFMDFHRLAMDMSLKSYFGHFQEMPIVSSLLNYKESFLALFEKSELNQMSFIKIGDIFAIKISQNSPKPHDLIVPILPEGEILKVSFNGENTKELSSRLYKYALYESNWSEDIEANFFDRIVMDLKDKKKIDINDAQNLYGHYYELSRKILGHSDISEYQLLKRVLSSVQLLIQGVVKDDRESLLKLESNVNDLVDAVEIRNLEYFNLSNSTLL